MRLKCHAAVVAAVVSLFGSAHAARPVAGSVTSERVKLPPGPSSVRGLADEPAVDPFYAQLEYEVPIELPAGYGGLAPSLALAYSGALGNGPLGIGWTLAEPRIQRSTRLGVPRFDDSDVLEIAGIASGRLVAIGGGEYRVEGYGQTVRVRKVGAGFEVDDGQGVHYRLGVSAGSRQEDGTRTLAWRLEDQTNLMGERIRYEYAHDRGQVYLSRIVWGPAERYTAELSYEARGDATTSYREGFRVVTGRRLAAIQVTALGSARRAYQLAYDATFPVARLAGVSSTGLGGSGAWPALSFSYAVPGPPVITPIAGVGNWRLNASGTTLVDLDGDGAADLLQLTSGGHRYLTNQNGTFAGLQALSGNAQAIAAVQLQDVDGDGRAELVQDTGNGWAVYKFSKTQWVSQAAGLPNGVWPGSPGLALKQPTTTRFADLNGDGLVDAIQWDNDNLKIHLATRTGLAAAYNVPRIGGAVLPSAQGRFHDANGDGLDDYLVAATDRLDVYLGHGDGTFEPVATVAYPFAGTVSNPEDLELADLDRDGLMDLVRVELGTVRWFRGRADGTFAATPVTLANPETLSTAVVVAIADSNGNGSQDVVWSSTSGMWRMDLAGTTTAGMLARVQNGLGMDVTFAYRSSHALAVEAAAVGSPWGSNVPIALPVPVQRTTALGPGETTRSTSYGVRDGSWDAAEQQFAGFLTTIVTTAGATAAETSSVTTRYHAGLGASRVLRGRPLVAQVKDGTGRRLSITTSTWEAMPVAGLPDVPLLRRAVLREQVAQYEDVTPVRKTDVTFSYDALGRLAHTVDSGRLDLTGDETVLDARYADDDATWIRDRVCEEKVSSAAGELVSHTQHLFGDDTRQEALCVVGKGWPREQRAWLASEARFVTAEQVRYDAHGNPIAVTRDGVERRLGYDAVGLFPTDERVTTAPGHELIWRAAWDEVLGTTTAVTDPAGHTTHASYDSLGRYTGAALDDRPPHQVIEYDWVAPFPRTTAWTFEGALEDVGARPATWSATAGWTQTVEVANGKGEVRYRARRLADAQWILSDYRERDASSRVVFAGRPVYASQLLQSGRPAGVAGDQLVYDPLGRLIEQQAPTGARSRYSYRAFETTSTTDELAPVTTELDGQGRIIRTARTIGQTVEAVEATYDPAGRITRLRLPAVTGAVDHQFTYDTLGRLVFATDPDIGARQLAYDDGGRLIRHTNGAGQVIQYGYDGAGRLVTAVGSDSQFTYHYDAALDAAFGNTAGRLAYVDEPTGGVQVGYDALGRQTRLRRTIDGHVAEEARRYGASGALLAFDDGDGLVLDIGHDAAGRVTRVGSLWQLEDQDAAGSALRERFGNGVTQTFARDAIGHATQIRIARPSGVAAYDAAVAYNAFGAIASVTDRDGVGLDHSAVFGFDGGARLTDAVLGTGAGAYHFRYAYDGLQNMIRREAVGPAPLGILVGALRYGEASGGVARGPRQLTSIVPDAAAGAPAGAPTTTLAYDAAGRTVQQGSIAMDYNGFDQLIAVHGAAMEVRHAYGFDGQRVRTLDPAGHATRWFTRDVSETDDGVRQIDVHAGDRLIARITRAPLAGASSVAGLVRGGVLIGGALALLLLVRRRRRAWRPRLAALGVTALVLASCGVATTGSFAQAARTTTQTIYYHEAIGAGATLLTAADGSVFDERRYEPFGAAIDARHDGAAVAAIDYARDPHNALNKLSDPATGWSDHGARWMAPETGRWLTPDPPVKTPDPALLRAPWALHPYQYVDQNPVLFWDPDGRDPEVKAKFKIETVLAEGSAVKGDVGPVTIKAGTVKVKTNNANIAVEASGMTVGTTFGGVGKANVKVFAVEGSVGTDGARWKASVAEVSASLKLGRIEGTVSFGLSAGGGAKWGGGRLEVELQFGIGFKMSVDLKGTLGLKIPLPEEIQVPVIGNAPYRDETGRGRSTSVSYDTVPPAPPAPPKPAVDACGRRIKPRSPLSLQ